MSIANTVYSPTVAEIALAKRNVAVHREAESKDRDAVGVEGVLVDAAQV